MSSLIKILGASERRGRVLTDLTRLVDQEVSGKRGLSALPLKAGYKVVKGLKPGFVRGALDHMLDEFCGALEPFYSKWADQPSDQRVPLSQALQRNAQDVSENLLGVSDRRAERSQNRIVRKTYGRLRKLAKGHVVAALPGLGRTIEPHLKE